MLTLQIVPYSEIAELSSIGRIRKLLNLAKQNKIVLLQGRLKREEEAELIKVTMEEINRDFKGIELAVIDDNGSKNTKGVEAVRSTLSHIFLGDRQGLTIIGPANVVKAIRKDPRKVELLTQELKKKKNKKR